MPDGKVALPTRDWANYPGEIDRLHPDLKPFVVEIPKLGQCLKAPLVFQVPGPVLPVFANEQYAQKSRELKEKLSKKNYSGALWLYERPYRMTMLQIWANRMPLEDFRGLLVSAWVDCEYPKQFGYPNLVRMFRKTGYVSDGDGPQPTEPQEVFRGIFDLRDRRGMSWTQNFDKAQWFAKRFSTSHSANGAYVYKTLVKPAAVLGTFTRRNEQEIVVDPKRLGQVEKVWEEVS